MRVNLKSLLFNVLVPLMLSFIVAMLVPLDNGYYESLELPFKLQPYVFTIIWSCLYILMGLSAYLIENSESFYSKKALKIYYLQLVLTYIYLPVFFCLQNIIISLIITVAILMLVIVLALRSYKINKWAAYLLIPYILWLIVATYLQVSLIV